MKKMKQAEIEHKVNRLVDDYICWCGLKNAKKILMLAYRRIREVEKRLNEKETM